MAEAMVLAADDDLVPLVNFINNHSSCAFSHMSCMKRLYECTEQTLTECDIPSAGLLRMIGRFIDMIGVLVGPSVIGGEHPPLPLSVAWIFFILGNDNGESSFYFLLIRPEKTFPASSRMRSVPGDSFLTMDVLTS